MALKHAETRRLPNGTIISIHYPEGAPNGAEPGQEDAPHVVLARLAAIAVGALEPSIPDLELLTDLMASKHSEEREASRRHADLEARHEGMQALHDKFAAAIAEGTGTTIEEIHAAAAAVAETLAIAHRSERVQFHIEALKDNAMNVLAELVAEHTRTSGELEAMRHEMRDLKDRKDTEDALHAMTKEVAPERLKVLMEDHPVIDIVLEDREAAALQ